MPARNSVIPQTSSRSSHSGGDSWLQSLLRWLPGEPEVASPPPSPPTDLVRADFQSTISDMPEPQFEPLRHAIRKSRGMQDLWHLRAWVYTEVARAHSQHEAERRLAILDAHFAKAGRAH